MEENYVSVTLCITGLSAMYQSQVNTQKQH